MLLNFESANLRVLSAHVPYMLPCFTCLVSYMLSCLTCSVHDVLPCLARLVFYVFSCFTYLMPYAFSFLTCSVSCLPSCLICLVLYILFSSDLLSCLTCPSCHLPCVLCVYMPHVFFLSYSQLVSCFGKFTTVKIKIIGRL